MSDRPNNAEFELLSMRRLLDASVPHARAALRSVFWPIALPVVTITTLGGIFQLRLLDRFMPHAQGEPDASTILDLMSMSAQAVGVSMVMIAIMAISFAALSVAVMDLLAGRPADMARAWRMAFQPSMLWTVGLCVVLSTVSMLMCLVPALVVVPMLTLVLPLALAEDARGLEAVSRGVALVRGRATTSGHDRPWVRALVILLVALVIGQAFALVVQGPFMILQQIWLSRDLASGGTTLSHEVLWLQVPMGLLGGLVQVLAWIYAAFTLGLLYRDLARRVDGIDLDAAIQALEAGEGATLDRDSELMP